MVTLFGNSLALNSTKVHLLLAEARRPFQFRVLDLARRQHLSPESMALNPFGRLPFIDDDGFRLAESNTIMRYLAGKWGLDEWYSPDPKERALIDQWMEFGAQHLNLSLGELYVSRWFAARFNWTMDLYAVDRALKDLARNLPLLDERLGRTPYVAASHPTLADLSILPFMMMAECAGLPLGAPYPHIAGWLTTMIRRPSWKEVADPRWPLADA